MDAAVKGACQSDPTWFKLRLILGDKGDQVSPDGKVIKADGSKGSGVHITLLVPTANIFYNGKKNLFLFKKLQSFCAAMGEGIDSQNYYEVLPRVFGCITDLIGVEIKVRLGYEGPHVIKSKEGDFWVAVDASGTPLKLSTPNQFEAIDLAKGQMVIDGIEIKPFLTAIKFYPGEARPAKPKKAKAKKAVTTDEDEWS